MRPAGRVHQQWIKVWRARWVYLKRKEPDREVSAMKVYMGEEEVIKKNMALAQENASA